MPVGVRPPWVKISKRAGSLGPADALRVHRDHDRLRAEFLRRFAHEFATVHRRSVDRNLVGAGEQKRANILHRAHATADGHRHEALLGRARHYVEDGAAPLVAGGDVEEAQFVGARGVIGLRGLDGITGVGEVDEANALDDTTVLHVETRNDADLERHAALRASRIAASAAAGSSRPS